jgi:cytochrome c oxidase subunit 2
VRAKPLLPVGLLAALALLLAPAAHAARSGGFVPVQPESSNAHDIRTIYLFISIFVLAIFVLVETLLVVFVLRYRRRKRARFEEGAEIHGATNLELLWTAGPIVVLLVIAVFVLAKLPGITTVPSGSAAGDPPNGRLRILVTGRQFYWQFRYPNGVIAINRMRAPAGVPVYLTVVAPANDVIHSWWIPALGGKIDAIPGIVNHTWFRADRPGVYRGQCAELCGLEHANMRGDVEVMPRQQFAAWLARRRAQQSAGTSPLGLEEWTGVCERCHGLAGQGGIATRIAGSAVLSDPSQVRRIVRSGTKTPRGTMPAVGSDWTDQQLTALTSYLKEHPPGGQ